MADRALPALGLPYLYLGYWIAESRKMAYKATFRPMEGLVGGVWARLCRRLQRAIRCGSPGLPTHCDSRFDIIVGDKHELCTDVWQ